MSQITKYDEDAARILRDPVLWAEKHLGSKPRWYQEQILRHPHNRIVLRMGRRLGKCIAGNQRILNAETGAYETIHSLYEKQIKQTPLFSLQEDYKLHKTESFYIEDNGIKPTFAVRVKHGAEVVLTGNHPVLTVEGWKEVDALKVGESIAVPKALPAFGKKKPGMNRAKIAAAITSSYQVTQSGPILSFYSPEVIEDFLMAAQTEQVTIFKRTKQNYAFHDNGGNYRNIIEERSIGVPAEVFEYDKEHLAQFLASVYDVNGWNYSKRVPEIGYGTRNQRMARDIKHLLIRFGIDANIIERNISEKPYFQLMLYAKKDVVSFIEQLSPYSKKDYSEVLKHTEGMTTKDPVIPSVIWKYVEKEAKRKKMKNYEVTGSREEKFRYHIGLSEEKARRYAENLQSHFLYDLGRSDVYWEEVTSIEPAGDQQTYDVFVPKTHNLVVEDILVHNTWTMCAHMLWVAFTSMGGTIQKGGATCIVATPYDSQAKLIYDQLCTFIDSNEVLANSIKSRTKNPYFFQFHNGSIIKLFTAGSKNGSGAANLRGQKADGSKFIFKSTFSCFFHSFQVV